MARTAHAILSAMNGESVPLEMVLRRFLFEGYGNKKARKWIREFIETGWIIDNNDGTLNIQVPYRH